MSASKPELHSPSEAFAVPEANPTQSLPLADDKTEIGRLLDNNPDIIARFGPDGRHLFINQTITRISGKPVEQFMGKTLRESGFPEPLSRLFDEHMQRVFRTGEAVAFEFTSPGPALPTPEYYVSMIPEMSRTVPGQVETVLAVTRNVTDFKRLERELRASEARFQAFMDHSPMLAYLKDEQGRYFYANEPLRKQFPSILGKTVFDIATPESAAQVTQHDQEVAHEGKTVSYVETFQQADEAPAHWLSYKFAVIDAGGRRSVGGMSLEVTAQKRIEAERESLVAELQEKNQRLTALNAEKNAFLGICSHDLKNPLNGIIGLAGLLKDSADEGSEAAEFAGDILQSAEFMFALVNNLLNVAAIEEERFPLEPAAFDLRAAAAHVSGRYRGAAAKKEIALAGPELSASETDAGRTFAVWADRNATLQVLDNLISNAVKYTPIGGRVEVRVQAQSENERVTVAVRDSGPGLRADEQAKLFQKFTRLSTRPTGGEHSTGLGLSIVKRLMGAMGGDVRCESQPGRGSTFLAEFPTAVP